MFRNIIHMVSIDGSYEHNKTAELSAKTWQYWANEIGADFVLDQESDSRFKNPIWNKWLMFERYPNYDKYCSIDCDTMIRWDAPNFFDQMNLDTFYAVNDIASLRWVRQSINDRQKWFPDVVLSLEKYWNSGVIWCSKHHRDAFSGMIDLYLNNKDEFDNWTKGGGVVQTLLNFFVAKFGYDLELIPPIWNLFSMHKTEMFSHNWQTNDPIPFFIKYAHVWHFTGFPIEQRLDIMNQTWNLTKHNYGY